MLRRLELAAAVLGVGIMTVTVALIAVHPEKTFRLEKEVPTVSAREREWPGTLGTRLGLRAVHTLSQEGGIMNRPTEKLFDEAIAQLEREIREEGYIDPLEGCDRAPLLILLYEGCGRWNRALSLIETILEEGATDTVRYRVAVGRYAFFQDRASRPFYLRWLEQTTRRASHFALSYFFLIGAAGGALLVLGSLRQDSLVVTTIGRLICWISVGSLAGRTRFVVARTFLVGVGMSFAILGVLGHIIGFSQL